LLESLICCKIGGDLISLPHGCCMNKVDGLDFHGTARQATRQSLAVNLCALTVDMFDFMLLYFSSSSSSSLSSTCLAV
jgi:hypothetical protein